MKKLLLIASFLLVGIVGVSKLKADQESFKVPVSANKVADIELKSAGVEKCVLITSTIPALVTDRNGTTMTNGLIYWVIAPSTGTTTANSIYAEFRDSATANVSSARIFPPIPVNIVSTGTTGAGVAAGQPGLAITRFDPPVPFYNGLSVNLQPAGTSAPAVNVEYAVGIRTKK